MKRFLAILMAVVLLLSIGVVMVFSASYARAYYDPGKVTGGNALYYFVRQLLFAGLGLGAMLFASRLPMGIYRRFALPFLAFVLVLLLLVVIGVFLQPEMLEEYADFADVSWRLCNLPLWNLAFMTAFLLVGVLLAGLLPRVAGALAFCGRWMLFIYAGHSYLLAPLYQWKELRWAWNVWVPVLVLPVLVLLAVGLSRVLPRTMALLQAKPWR